MRGKMLCFVYQIVLGLSVGVVNALPEPITGDQWNKWPEDFKYGYISGMMETIVFALDGGPEMRKVKLDIIRNMERCAEEKKLSPFTIKRMAEAYLNDNKKDGSLNISDVMIYSFAKLCPP